MLTKDQANRVADGLIAAAQAQSDARAEQLTGGITRLYPELKAWPAGDRRAVLRLAENAVAWDWRQGAIVGIALALLGFAAVMFAHDRHLYYWLGSTLPVLAVLAQLARRSAIRRRLRLISADNLP
jgi:protein-S-isoprenylcysteine O-methyltransferase Ste14